MSRTMLPTIVLDDFTKGEASIFPIFRFKRGFSVKLENCHISKKGGISKNPGYTKVNTVAVADSTFMSGVEYRRTNGTVERIVVGGGKVYKEVSGVMTALQTIAGADFTCNSTAVADYAQLNDILVMCNGVDAPWYYDGTNCDSYTNHGSLNPPPATTDRVHSHGGHIHFLSKDEMTDVLSDLNDGTETTGTGAGTIEFKLILKKGDQLMDMASYVNLAVFYFRDHIIIYSGTNISGSVDIMARTQLVEGTGVVGINCIQTIGTDQLFLSSKGLKSLKQVVTTGSLNMGDLSEFIDPTFMTAINAAASFASAHWPQRSWLLFMLDKVIYVYSYVWKAWGRITGADVNGLFHTIDGTLYFCGTSFIYQYGVIGAFDWAGIEFEWVWEMAWFSASSRGKPFYPKMATIFIEPGVGVDIKVETVYDNKPVYIDDILNFSTAEDVDLMDTARSDVWDGTCSVAGYWAQDLCEAAGGVWTLSSDPFYMDGTMDILRIPMFGGGTVAQLKFSETSGSGPVEITKILIDAEVAQ